VEITFAGWTVPQASLPEGGAGYGNDIVKLVERTLVSALADIRIDSILAGVIATVVSAVRPIQGIKEVIESTTYITT
jgi:hypothetical protein